MADSDNRVGLIYDERMADHACPWDAKHPECPERFTESLKRVRELGVAERCQILKPRQGSEDEIRGIHSQRHIDLVKDFRNCTEYEGMEKFFSKYDSVFMNEHSFDLALSSVGCTVDLMKEVLNGNLQHGMAVIRPPGHHAMTEEYCGYCLFNNVAIAARHAIDHMGLERILVVDWDVHHGQATQFSFYDDPRVLYFSIHRYQHGTFWPELRESEFDHTGKVRGLGFNVNVPLNATGMENSDYMAIFHQVLLPLAAEYKPQLILVSCGFDASLGDPEGEMRLTPAMYSHMTALLMPIAKLCVILEGGYCIPAVAEGVALVLKTLLGDPCPRMVHMDSGLPHPCEKMTQTIKDVVTVLKGQWSCLVQDVPDEHSKIEYYGILGTEKPETYPTRDYHMTLSDEEKTEYLNQQADLRQKTELIRRQNVVHYSGDWSGLNLTECKKNRIIVIRGAEAPPSSENPELMLNFNAPEEKTFLKVNGRTVLNMTDLVLATDYECLAILYFVILPVFYEVYPKRVIIVAPTDSASTTVRTLFTLCCEYLSIEGGCVIVSDREDWEFKADFGSNITKMTGTGVDVAKVRAIVKEAQSAIRCFAL